MYYYTHLFTKFPFCKGELENILNVAVRQESITERTISTLLIQQFIHETKD